MTGTTEPPLILHVIHHLHMGGMENGLVNLINRMPEARFRHAIACVEDFSDFRQRLRRPDVQVVALRRSKVGIWRLRRELFQLCRQLRPKIVHSRNMSGLDALLPASLAGARRVHGEHGWDVNDLEGDQWKPAFLRRIHAPLVDRYIVVSKQFQHYLTERVGVAASRITQIYNGVDTERFAPAGTRQAGVLPAGFAVEDSVVIGTVARIQPVKDQETLVRAFAALSNTASKISGRVRLAIIGDGPLLPHLRSLVETLGISRTTWLPGAVSNVPEVMRSLDLFVLPSLAEGISNTILEAMACGLPVVATAAGGNSELLQDGRGGRLFQARDVQALAGLLAEYAADPPLRQTQARLARQHVLENFGLDSMIQSYQSVYEQLC